MWEKYTGLSEEDYKHLGRFLDVTKSNLFFARGLILVEWIAEALIIPQLADIIYWEEWILDSNGISVVCLNWLTFDRYLNAFIRKDNKSLDIKISAITDRDWRLKLSDKINKTDFVTSVESNKEDDFWKIYQYIEWVEYNNSKIKKFYNLISTLEYDLGLSCLSEELISARHTLYKQKTISDFKSEINDQNKYNKALKLYWKIEKQKWETAQELADILYNSPDAKKNTLKDVIKSDIYLKYIVDALNHVIEDNND